jgi:hypothetical protein
VLDSLVVPTCDDQIDRPPVIATPGTFEHYFQVANLALSNILSFGRCFYALWPEWPYAPYLSIRAADRKRRLDLLFPNPPDSIESLAAQITPRAPVPGTLPLEVFNYMLDLLGEKKTVEDVHFRFDYSAMSIKEILRCVEAHLKLHHPGKAKRNVVIRSLRSSLNALGALSDSARNRTQIHKPSITLRRASITLR